jgi:hypothetical protein
MRALLADHDRVMLEAVRRTIGSSSGITLDIASSKQECIELLHSARCEVLIACERLTDGSGLELLGQVARRSPATLRIFAAEPARLALLIGGRLTPFRLYQTLPYPIAADVLLPLLVQARAHSLESVLPTAPLRTRLTPATHSRSAAEFPPAPPPPATPTPTIQSVVPSAQQKNIGHRRLLIGTTLLLSAALVLLVVHLQSAHSAGARAVSAPASPSVNWNAPAVTSIVSELELALARRDNARARAALEKLRSVAPTHPRIGFFETRLQQIS